MISVLVTTYNGAEYVIEQLESIRDQTRPVDEVVISDDVSNDGTVDLVRKFIQENRLTGWTLRMNTENLGPAGNSFRLLPQASGDVVFLADQDDVWGSEKVRTMMALFDANHDVAAIMSTESLINAHGEPITNKRLQRSVGRNVRVFRGSRNLLLEDLVGNASVPWHSLAIRRSVIEKALAGGLPRVGMSLGADWYIGLIATCTGQFVQLGEPLVRRRVHDANASLGRLRKTSLLTASNERRAATLAEIADVHDFVLSSPVLSPLLTPEQATSVSEVAKLFHQRASFCLRPSLVAWLTLLRSLNLYHLSYVSWRMALRMWITDLLYAYDINWATK